MIDAQVRTAEGFEKLMAMWKAQSSAVNKPNTEVEEVTQVEEEKLSDNGGEEQTSGAQMFGQGGKPRQ
ncbi:hypothetical protein A2U01_0097514 [Trifolium medium]|nr:hypothetical protein [Trifolium medium]